MNRRLAISLFVASALLIGVAYASGFLPGGPPPWAAWLFALGTATILIAATALGALQSRSAGLDRRLAAAFAFTWLILFGGFALALTLPPETTAGPLWLGLPRRAAIVLYGIGLLPLLVLPVAYAATFDAMTLSEDDLRRVRAAAAALRERSDAPEAGS